MTTTSSLVIPRPDMLPRPAPRPVAAVRQPSTDAFVAVSGSGGYCGWAMKLGANDPISGRLRGGIADAAAVVVERLAELCRTDDVRVALYCATSLVREQATGVEGLEAYPVGIARQQPGMFEVAQAASAQADRALAMAPRLVVAADGSWGRAVRSGGWAFLAADGTFCSESGAGLRSSVHAELRAIRLALMTIPSRRSLTIRTDSRVAIAWLEDPSRAHRDLRTEVVGINALIETRDVRFQWVKGHVGPGLHDGADRLAVSARRAREAGLGVSAPAGVAARVVAESLAAHRAGGKARPWSTPEAARSGRHMGLAA